MSIRKLFIPILVLVLISFNSISQKWVLKLDKDGIKVYTRTIEGSSVQEFKGEITVKSNLGNILAVIDSIPAYPNWMYKCSDAKRLKKTTRESGYIYSVLASPWPISDRDICTFYTVRQDTNTKIVTISMKGVKDYLPEKPDKVRVPSLKGSWQLIPIAKGVTKIVYQVHCESGGSVPAAIVNAYITDTPYYNLLNLKKIVESPISPKSGMKEIKEL
jgi:hypothetical protein